MPTSTNKEIAHFFWEGTLSLLEINCIKSFVRCGFDVKLWSYDNLSVEGAESCDAEEIVPKDKTKAFNQRDFFNSLNKDFSNYTSAISKADLFHWEVIVRKGGWWFDADCYCLKSSDEFTKLKQNRPIVAALHGLVGGSMIGNGVLYADKDIALKGVDEFYSMIEAYYPEYPPHPLLGPGVTSNLIQKNGLEKHLLSNYEFCTIDFTQFDLYINPAVKEVSKSLIKDSYIAHLWNSQFMVNGIDKNNPPEGSLIYEMYHNYDNTVPANEHVKQHFKDRLEKYIAVSTLYREVLGRAADFYGIDHYSSAEFSIDRVREIFYNSEEFRNKPKFDYTYLVDESKPHLGGNFADNDVASYSESSWKYLVDKFNIKSCLDVGSGRGFSAKYINSLGVEVTAIDGLHDNVINALVPTLEVDLTAQAYIKAVDFVNCVEVVEHIDEEFINNLMDTLTSGQYVLITHAFPGQDGWHHVNCQPSEYWIEKFNQRGYVLSDETNKIRTLARADNAGHIERSGLFFQRS